MLALITYFLIKITPAWGLTLLFTTFAFFTPLVYIKNQELIDHHLSNAQSLLNEQATQVRDMAQQHTSKAMEASQTALKDYSAKAGELIGGAKQAAVEKGVVSQETVDKLSAGPGGSTAGTTVADANLPAPAGGSAVNGGVTSDAFPAAPKTELTAVHDGTTEEKEPLLAQ